MESAEGSSSATASRAAMHVWRLYGWEEEDGVERQRERMERRE